MAKLGMIRPVAAAMVLALTSGCGWGRTVADKKAMESDGPIKPDPYLKAYAWAGSLQSPGSDSSK
ncbi:hypothetical protein [Bifidobacterium longum]|uniref:hypothetical protein n=1 Tax=Bifidobacterium longum TaxID=216816 RepID=UPI00117CCF0E|nr:hypothetical protein [Bifidobacterium longum]